MYILYWSSFIYSQDTGQLILDTIHILVLLLYGYRVQWCIRAKPFFAKIIIDFKLYWHILKFSKLNYDYNKIKNFCLPFLMLSPIPLCVHLRRGQIQGQYLTQLAIAV